MEDKIALLNLLRKCFSQDKISMNYHGVFDDTFTEQLVSLADCDVEKKAKKRMALLISESFQNIVRHGDNELGGENNSLFGIRGIDQFLHIFSSNSVTKSTKEFLEKKLEEINKMDKDQIKVLYAEALENGVISNKGGAGLGLIEMSRKSERPIQKEFKKLDNDLYAFYMQIDLIIDDSPDKQINPHPISIEENEEIHELIVEHDIVFLYKGDFGSDIMDPILSIMKQNTDDDGKSTGFNIFHAAVELMQNIVRYGKEINGKKEGIFSLNKTKNGYYLCTGNYTERNSKDFENFITEINEKDKTELDQLYRKTLKENIFKEGNSAGVGLIDLRRSIMTTLDVKTGFDMNGTYLMIGIEIPFK